MSPIADVRPLTPDERRLLAWLLKWLLNQGTPEADPYLKQLPLVSVVSRCGCGCPTIVLAVGDHAAPVSSPTTILADGAGVSPEGVRVGIIVHGREDSSQSWRSIRLAGDAGTFSLPELAILRVSVMADLPTRNRRGQCSQVRIFRSGVLWEKGHG